MSETSTQQFRRQFPRNMAMNVLGFVVHFASGICLIPYLVRTLGKEAYGLVPIASMLTQYVAMVTASISLAVTRFLTIEIQREDHKAANQVFNTALFSYLGLALVQVPLYAVAIVFTSSLVNVSPLILADTKIMLGCSGAAFLLGLLAGPAGVSLYAKNRLDLIKTIEISCQCLRIVLIITFFSAKGASLRYVGLADLIVSVIRFSAICITSGRLTPYLRPALSAFRWGRALELLSMGVWVVINALGSILYLSMDVWVVNRFVGPEEAGVYAALLPWGGLVRQIGGLFSGIIGPMLLIYYARNEMTQFVKLGRLSVKFMSIVCALLVGLICGFREPLLRLWLGPEFVQYGLLLFFLVIHLMINISVYPLFNIQTAMNKVKAPGLVTLTLGLMNFVLAIILAKSTRLGIYAPALAGAVMLTMKNALFTPIFNARILDLPCMTFLTPLWNGLIITGLLVPLLSLFSAMVTFTWVSLIFSGGACAVVTFFLAWHLLISKNEKMFIESMIPERLRLILLRGGFIS